MPQSDERSWIIWHRLFGIALKDLLSNLPIEVELEKDLSLRQQFLDVVILKKHDGPVVEKLPDGLDNLAEHNLLTYKSVHEPFDDWTLKELTAHYVNYRKQESGKKHIDEGAFRLYGVSTRQPHKLSNQLRLDMIQDGVYEVQRGTDVIRLIVLREMPEEIHNAFWHLFSAEEEKICYASKNYQLKTPKASSVLTQVMGRYRLEGLNMPYTMEQFMEETKQMVLEQLNSEERQRFVLSLSPAERGQLLHSLAPEERGQLLHSLPAEERVQLLECLTVQERLRGLSLEEIKAYLASREANDSGTNE